MMFSICFIAKNKNKFREKDSNSKTTLIKEINGVEYYKNEEDYPYYKSLLYSDYLDIHFFKRKLEENNKEKYPVVDLYLNKKNDQIILNKEFINFNFVIKSLLNQYSGRITRYEAKKLTFEKTTVYKQYQNACDIFIEIVNSKNKGEKLTKWNNLENFLIDGSIEKGKKFIEIYKEYAENQNDLLKDIIEKINAVNIDALECQEINIQEAQRGDLLTLEIENKNEFDEIFLMNTYREIYDYNSKVKYNNYNLYSVNFDKIEKLLEDTLIKNACFLKVDEIIEMKYLEEGFLNDGISEFNKNIKQPECLNEKDKMEFLIFYDKNLQANLITCLEINEELKNIVIYINKNFNKINKRKSLYDIINEGGFPYKINDDLKEFLKNNKNIIVSKLSNLIIYFENLYFELAMEKEEIYKEKLDEDTKNKFDKYYNNKNGHLLSKEKLSITIIKFLLNVLMNHKNEKSELIEKEDNLFGYLSYKFLWNKEIYSDNRFTEECKEFKNLGIYIKNSYDFNSYISMESKNKFNKEKKEILDKIRLEEIEKIKKEKAKEEEEKKIEKINEKNGDNHKNNYIEIDEDDMDDLDNY